MLVGGIDLSVPWVLNAGAILVVTTSLGQDGRASWAVLLTLAMGLGFGLLNGLAVAFLAVPAVVITLAMGGVARASRLACPRASPARPAPPTRRRSSDMQ